MLNAIFGQQSAVQITSGFAPIPLRYPGYRIARATRREELEAVFRRRHHVFCEKMGAFPCNRQGFELDPFDPSAEHIYASINGIVVGCLRLVRDSNAGYPLEDEGARLPDSIPRATTVEGGRFNAEAIEGYDIARDLMAATFRWSRRHGVTHWVGINNVRSIHSLQRQGWPVERCGEPINHGGVAYYPYSMCLEVARLLMSRTSHIAA